MHASFKNTRCVPKRIDMCISLLLIKENSSNSIENIKICCSRVSSFSNIMRKTYNWTSCLVTSLRNEDMFRYRYVLYKHVSTQSENKKKSVA